MVIRLMVCAVLVLAWSSWAEAACTAAGAGVWTAAGLTETDFSDCNTAASDGDTVNFPAGSATWTTAVTITKRLNLVGATCTLDGEDRPTSCTSAITVADMADPDISLDLGTTNSSVSYFSFYTSTMSGSVAAFIRANGTSGVGRIHHNKFEANTATSRRAIYVDPGAGEGAMPVYLIDHNTFIKARVSMYAATGVPGADGHHTWETDHALGDYNHPIIESNTFDFTGFTQGNCIELDRGASATARFNDVIECPFEAHTISNGGTAGGRIFEVYGNAWTSCYSNMAIYIRSGGGVFFSNTFPAGDCTYPVIIDNSGRSTGNCDGVTNPLDGTIGSGPTYPAAGWPCFNQTGFGTYDGAHDHVNYPGMAKAPVPLFLNRKGASVTHWTASSSSEKHIANCNETQNEVAAASFDGTCGTGVGTAAQFAGETTCTATLEEVPGNPGTAAVYYWVTDEGEWDSTNGATPDGRLYKCTATDTWTLFYTPYPYPYGAETPDPAPVRIRISGEQ